MPRIIDDQEIESITNEFIERTGKIGIGVVVIAVSGLGTNDERLIYGSNITDIRARLVAIQHVEKKEVEALAKTVADKTFDKESEIQKLMEQEKN
jgi:hypothetical protein